MKITFTQLYPFLFICSLQAIHSCNSKPDHTNSSIVITSAMKDVMWKGELSGKIKMDTVTSTKGIYGVGPLEGLRGEITIMDSEVYVSTVAEDGRPAVRIDPKVTAPFFVRAQITTWDTLPPPSHIKTINDLDNYLNESVSVVERPSVFLLSGTIKSGKYHIQNLPPGTKVSNPDEAHSGQVKYDITNMRVDIVGFFSTDHKGIFTHHDSNVHLHVISQDRKHMGHLDEAVFAEMMLMIGK